MLQAELARQGFELVLHETHGSEEALDLLNESHASVGPVRARAMEQAARIAGAGQGLALVPPAGDPHRQAGPAHRKGPARRPGATGSSPGGAGPAENRGAGPAAAEPAADA